MRKLFIILFIFCAVSTFAKDKFTTHVTLTTYNAVVGQCDNDPLTMADGTKIDKGKLKRGKFRCVALSRPLLKRIPYGSVIHIEGHGYYEVHDTMNKRFTDNRVDILQHEKQKNFKKKDVKITLISTPPPKKKVKA